MKEFLAAALLTILVSGVAIASTDFSDTQVKEILENRLKNSKPGIGIVVGFIDEKGPRIVARGTFGATDKRPLDGDTVFEIGSMTKAFTGTLLAIMVERGEVKLDDPISKYLPANVKVPTRNGRQITLLDLATQSSGLPRLPTNFQIKDENNPYKDYTVSQLYEFLSSYTLTRDIGAEYEYSNLGMGLLGHLLALKAGTNYEALVLERICAPLKMTNTVVTLSADLQSRLAQGHDAAGNAASNWDIPTLAGAGALRSTANDLLKFAAANAGLSPSSLLRAMQVAHQARHSAGATNMEIGLAWHISTKYGTPIVWHNGQTGGYHSFLGFDAKNRRSVVVLANMGGAFDDIGFHLLDSRYELAEEHAGIKRVAIRLDPKDLDPLIGRYQLMPGAFFNIRRDSDKLMVQLTGQDYYQVFPETKTNFYYTIVDAQLTFNKDPAGKVTGLVLHQNGADQTAKKISDEAPPTPKAREVVKVDPKIYDAYAGQYELAPGAVFTVRRDGDRLLVQLTGQASYEVFPESETRFFYKIVDAQLTFVKGTDGKVTSLILHQNGLDQKAKRIK